MTTVIRASVRIRSTHASILPIDEKRWRVYCDKKNFINEVVTCLGYLDETRVLSGKGAGRGQGRSAGEGPRPFYRTFKTVLGLYFLCCCC